MTAQDPARVAVEALLAPDPMPEGWRPPPGWEKVPRNLWPQAYAAITNERGTPPWRAAVKTLRRWNNLTEKTQKQRREKRKRKTAAKSRRKNRR